MVVKIQNNKNYAGIRFESDNNDIALKVPIFLINETPVCIFDKLGSIRKIGENKYKWTTFTSRNFEDYATAATEGTCDDLRMAMQQLAATLPAHVNKNMIKMKLRTTKWAAD